MFPVRMRHTRVGSDPAERVDEAEAAADAPLFPPNLRPPCPLVATPFWPLPPPFSLFTSQAMSVSIIMSAYIHVHTHRDSRHSTDVPPAVHIGDARNRHARGRTQRDQCNPCNPEAPDRGPVGLGEPVEEAEGVQSAHDDAGGVAEEAVCGFGWIGGRLLSV